MPFPRTFDSRLSECKDRFYRLVYPAHPNDWELDEILKPLAEQDDHRQALLFSQVPAIWPVSHSLCLAFLQEGAERVGLVPDRLVPGWVRLVLERYESGGLAAARAAITNVAEDYVEPSRRRSKVGFDEISTRMTLYLRGLSGADLRLSAGARPSTDTETIYLPQALDFFGEYSDNEFFYKLLITLHWQFIRQGTLRLVPTAAALQLPGRQLAGMPAIERAATMADVFELFPDPLLAADLFFVDETALAMRWVRSELPGLAERLLSLRQVFQGRESAASSPSPGEAVELWAGQILFASECADHGPLTNQEPGGGGDADRAFAAVERLVGTYLRFARYPGAYCRPVLLEMLGVHEFRLAARTIERIRAERRESFIAALARVISGGSRRPASVEHSVSAGGDQTAVIVSDGEGGDGKNRPALIIENEHCELPEELQRLLRDIRQDLGELPQGYVAAAAGRAGMGLPAQHGGQVQEQDHAVLSGIQFDEWDYRRNGYRRDWCSIFEKKLPLAQTSFVSSTLEKHRGLLVRLRRQFEMLRVHEHFVGRQREGDDFDLDAVVDARADHLAGMPAEDRLYVRLLRNDRDLATLFLVDMSNSTQGWVGVVIREALLLLSQVMGGIGDRFGIYGFSGMRRSRCELFPVKHLEEPYSEAVGRRIGSIRPCEYTRIGPAIRFGSSRLRRFEARTRLLVLLTDGKPEDYDDYKGEYAVEDTRKALLEARGVGIRTFCITVDRKAHDYLPRMFAGGDYILVDDLEKLPIRMINMYRMLTT